MATALVYNTQSSSVCFEDGGKFKVTFNPKGDPTGKDWQEVPEEILDNMDFKRAIRQGILAVSQSTPEETEDRLATSANAWKEAQAKKATETTAVVEVPKMTEIVGLSCVGPDARGNRYKCGNMVPVSGASRDKPPLCNTHQMLAPKFGQMADEDDPGKLSWKQMVD